MGVLHVRSRYLRHLHRPSVRLFCDISFVQKLCDDGRVTRTFSQDLESLVDFHYSTLFLGGALEKITSFDSHPMTVEDQLLEGMAGSIFVGEFALIGDDGEVGL